ncbi:hypothetical protein [Nocardioides panaciterrulae]|uniref:Uncharacterized protein n=1 Tax=Nocardioides panaciterrulae TaxID=661492 RepID=A0A7Y9EAQ7_9ACTN|nr:hypothetical protein [Nocardioides panaciterrulae]NYD39923.1 hypothetical protein [Nocardioides panaciterrulae]NYD43955.1 hypothetical protein [Nocardioides panaciterrulae]
MSEDRCACGSLTLSTTVSERHDRGLHGADGCVGVLPWLRPAPDSTPTERLEEAVEAVLTADSRRTDPIPIDLADALDQLRRCRYGARRLLPANADPRATARETTEPEEGGHV